ncbi:MAG: hypothetical protein P4L51_23195 [Puia sp.]|nr:hypothetical protein [Puia sp.]
MTTAIIRSLAVAILAGPMFLFSYSQVEQDAARTTRVRQVDGYSLNTRGLSVRVSAEGHIVGIRTGGGEQKPVDLFTAMDGCVVTGKPTLRLCENGAIELSKEMRNDSLGTACWLVERLIPTKSSIRWELDIIGTGKPWGTVIHTRLAYPVKKQSAFWTSWGEPPYRPNERDTSWQKALANRAGGSNRWIDPLIATPFCDSRFYYGAPYLEYGQPRVGFCPMGDNLFCIPMYSILEPSENAGMTLVLSPEDNIIDLTMETTAAGEVSFSRLFNRIAKGDTLRLHMDLVGHGADWRSGLAWMSRRYPGYFFPKGVMAGRYGGTGAYSDHSSDFDATKMKKMAFTVNWQASFDFPYMGMFLPPVGGDEKWTRYGNGLTSIRGMNAYAASMKQKGFFVFNYFNVTEFGANIKYPYTVRYTPADSSWKDDNEFLYGQLSSAILKVPGALNLKGIIYPKTRPGGPFYTWGDGVIMDCGDPVYRAYLLNQAKRHIEEIPDAFGICIDRMDWLRMFNFQADDGITWFDGKPVRSLISSFKRLLNDMGPLMHRAGKSILVNNHDKRIDLLKEVDGIFDEFTYSGIALNTSALLCTQKPALGWTDDAATVKSEGEDAFFQRYLYMGMFPMCPFPGNDHSIRPNPLTDQWYLDYGQLMNLMKDRQWVLKPGVISVRNDEAKANVFKTPRGYVIPVVYAQNGVDQVDVSLTDPSLGGKHLAVMAYHPGIDDPVTVTYTRVGNKITMSIPLVRQCSMVLITAR